MDILAYIIQTAPRYTVIQPEHGTTLIKEHENSWCEVSDHPWTYTDQELLNHLEHEQIEIYIANNKPTYTF